MPSKKTVSFPDTDISSSNYIVLGFFIVKSEHFVCKFVSVTTSTDSGYPLISVRNVTIFVIKITVLSVLSKKLSGTSQMEYSLLKLWICFSTVIYCFYLGTFPKRADLWFRAENDAEFEFQ